jgi:integrase family protein with SAM-like domain
MTPKNAQNSALPTPIVKGLLTRQEFQQLADVPPELEWFANIDNARTRRAYQIDLKDFMSFVGITNPSDFRMVTRAHLIAWRKDLEQRELGGATIRRKLAALSSLFEYLCERNAVESNPVRLILDSRVLCDQQLNERRQQCFASFSDIGHKREATEVEREFLWRNAPRRTKPTPPESPEALHSIHMHCTQASALFLSGVRAPSMVHALMAIPPHRPAGIKAVLVRIRGFLHIPSE